MEYGEYKGHMYALTLDSIYESICNGKVCTITSQSQSLTTLRCSAIKPLVILIKPPALDKLKQLKIYTGEKSTRKLTVCCRAQLTGVSYLSEVFRAVISNYQLSNYQY